MKLFRISLLAAFLGIVFPGCYHPPDFGKLAATFRQKRAIFERLAAMIKEDGRGREYMDVGDDHIGKYWEDGRGSWSRDQGDAKEVPLAAVLAAENISQKRYATYMKFLSEIGSERVSYYSGKDGDWTGFLMDRSGIAVSGSSTTIEVNGNGRIPKSEKGEGWATRILPIADGWYIEYNTT